MSTLQIVTTSALLLACVYLSLGAHIPNRRAATGVTVHPAITRTGTEAINAKTQVDDYLKKAYSIDDVTAKCSALVSLIDLPCPQDAPGCDSMVNASNNLQNVLYMYSHVVGLIYQRSTDEKQMEQLDLLEMMYYRLSKQMQRYLQARNLSSGNTKHIDHLKIFGEIAALEQEFTHLEIANSALCQLRDIAISTLIEIGEENSQLRPYKFCTSLTYLNC